MTSVNTHSLLPDALIVFHNFFRVKSYKLAGPVNLGDQPPIPVVPLTLDHPGK